MPAIRFAVVLLTGLVLASFPAQPVQAQNPVPAAEPAPAQEPIKQLQDQLPKLLPSKDGGKPIQEDQKIWAYVAGIAAFIITFCVAWVAVKVLAFLVILGAFLGGIALSYFAVRENIVATWEQLGLVVVYLGVTAGFAAVTANLFLAKRGSDDKD